MLDRKQAVWILELIGLVQEMQAALRDDKAQSRAALPDVEELKDLYNSLLEYGFKDEHVKQALQVLTCP